MANALTNALGNAQSFIFGPGTEVPSYEALKKRREVADLLAKQAVAGTPQNVGEGLAAVGRALASRFIDARLGPKEDAERQRVTEALMGAMGGGFTGRGMDMPARTSGDVEPAVSTASPSLVQSESGGNFQAQNDVTGSSGRKGHFGRLQFSLDRLDDAKRAGVIPSAVSVDQFLNDPKMQQATEQWHFSDIDREIVNSGLDKAIGTEINGVPLTWDGLRNVAHLGGKGGMKKYVSTRGQYNPADANGTRLSDYAAMGYQAMGMPAGGGGGPNWGGIMEMSELLQNPYLSEGQRLVAQAWIQQQMQPQGVTPMQAAQFGFQIDQANQPKPIDRPASVDEYLFAQENGFAGSYEDWIKAKEGAGAPSVSTTVNTGNTPDSRPMADKPPKGFQRRWNPEANGGLGSWVDEPIPGGEAAMEQEQAAQQSEQRAEQKGRAADIVLDEIGRSLDTIENSGIPATGTLGSVFSLGGRIAEAPQSRLESYIQTIEGNLAFDRLQQMREASPTGGALGAVSERELDLLSSTLGTVRASTDRDDLVYNLKRLNNLYLDIIHGKGNGPERYALGDEGQQPDIKPRPGEVVEGYRYNGGDPADPSNWSKVQ